MLTALAVFLCSGALVRAQAPLAAAAPTTVTSFSAEPYVIKSLSSVTDMHADGTGSRTQTFSVVIQSQSALHDFGVISLVYAGQSEHAEFVYARVIHPDGTTQETPVSAAMEQPMPVTTEAPEYSDLKSRQLPVRSLRVGDTLEWQMHFVVDHPEAPNQFWGQDTFLHGVVVLDETYELRVPSGFHLTVWTNPRSGVVPTESDLNGEHIYRWHCSDLKPTVGAAAEAAKKAEETRPRTPDEELDDTKGELPGFAWSTFPDWAAVGAWYRSLTADRITPDAAIRAKVAELTAGKTTDLDKAQAVYNYVSDQIHYIGIDFGIGRYQPHTASEVFANQYGDCKDKHVLLASMLSALSIPADPVLIGAGIRFNSAIASPSAFNHLITHLTLDGKEVWLDATSEVAPWGSLLNVVRDKEALVIPASSTAVVRQTPKDLPDPQVSSMAVVGSLDKDLTSDSTITLTFRDDNELYLRAALRSVSPSNYGEFVQRFMGGMGFGGTTSEAAIGNLDDPSHPLQIAFHYHRVKDKDWGGNRVTATFQSLDAPAFTPDHPPTETIQLGALRTETSTVKMQLPKGWSAAPPSDVHAHTPFANCDITYHFSDGTLTTERRFTVLESKVPLADYKKYQSWYDDAGAGSVPYIDLVPPPPPVSDAVVFKPAPEAPAVSAGTTHLSDPKAADLVRDAMRSLQGMDLDTGRKDLDDAEKINPTEPGLWSGYAMAAQLLGKQTEVLADLQHEITYHPDETLLFPVLYQGQIRMGDRTDALKTLHAWEKAAPDDPTPPTDLVNELTRSKNYSDALREGWEAIDRLQPSHPDLVELRIATANAQADMGQTKEAAAAVEPLLKTVTDPMQQNDIDYVLAEANVDLEEARATQVSIIAKAEGETADWSADTNYAMTMQQQSHLAADWDTLGWILYRQGQLEDAFSYCLAALYIDPNQAVRNHVIAIANAQHKPSAITIAHKSDPELRTIHLAPSNGRHGVASVNVLLSGGKVLDSHADANASSSMPKLAGAKDLLDKADLRVFFPPGSTARLVHSAFVNCSDDSCSLILAPIAGTFVPVVIAK